MKRTPLKRKTPLAGRGELKRTPMVRRRKAIDPGDPDRDPGRLAEVRRMQCAHCGAPPPSQAAHVRRKGSGGMGRRPPDRWTIPLCARCHGEQHAGRAPDSATCYGYLVALLGREP